MTTVVISQPMYFPWTGMFEQLQLADFFVHYDDVQLPQGRSFISRVQIKTRDGAQWLTVPVKRVQGQSIAEAKVDDSQRWRRRHVGQLAHALAGAPHRDLAVSTLAATLDGPDDGLALINIRGFEMIAALLGLRKKVFLSSSLECPGCSTERLITIVKRFRGNRYVTGHGAANYLDHEAFERAGIAVEYIKYSMTPYPQLYGAFTPYVTILDLIANTGVKAASYLRPTSIPWREFVARKSNINNSKR